MVMVDSMIMSQHKLNQVRKYIPFFFIFQDMQCKFDSFIKDIKTFKLLKIGSH